jgi:hypothetical protein
MTPVEFLQARLAEDELTALAAVDDSPHWRANYDYRDVKDGHGRYVVQADSRHPSVEQAAHIGRYVVQADSRHPSVEQAAHIARHSPARVLADVEATRLLIAEYLRVDAAGDVHTRAVIEDVLRALCSVHRDHPEYNPSWT